MNHIESIYFHPKILALTKDEESYRAQFLERTSPNHLANGVDTDAIIPADACKTPDPEYLAEYALTGWMQGEIKPHELKKISPQVLVAGNNFGSGSSREHAPLALMYAGVYLVIADSFSPIFRRNAVALGLYTSPDKNLIEKIQNGEAIPLSELTKGLDSLSAQILRVGGLLPYLRHLESGDITPPQISTEPRSMTIAEKWLARYLHVPYVKPGDSGFITPNNGYSYEYTAPLSFRLLKDIETVHDPDNIVLFNDHLSLDKDDRSQKLEKEVREFAAKHHIAIYDTIVNPENMGICHTIMAHRVLPGIQVGTDSHTPMIAPAGGYVFGIGATEFAGLLISGKVPVAVPESVRVDIFDTLPPYLTARDIMLYLSTDTKTYCNKVIEFGGPGLKAMSFYDLLVIANASTETRAITAVFEPTPTILHTLTRDHKVNLNTLIDTLPKPDYNAHYSSEKIIHLNQISPYITTTHQPESGVPLDEYPAFPVNKVIIGACVGGNFEDIKLAATLLRNRKVNSLVRLIIHPNSKHTFREAEKYGYLDIIQKAGGIIIADIGCGECVGNGPERLSENDVVITNESRPHTGRMGHPNAKVHIANTVVCTVAALIGRKPSVEELKSYLLQS